MNKGVCYMAIFLTLGASACTDTLKKEQAFQIFVSGEYTLLEKCPSEPQVEGSVSISREKVQVDHTVCDLKAWDVQEEPTALELDLINCRSDSGTESDRTTILVWDENNEFTMTGWSESTLPVKACEF